MPDWLTHTIIGWITGKTTRMEVGLVVLGSILPDLQKMQMITIWLGTDYQKFLFDAFHTPVIALLIGGIISLFFEDIKKAFLALGIGIATHFILDFFLIGTTKGIQFLYPLSWRYWRYNSIQGDFRITLIAVVMALCVYIYYFYKDRRKISNEPKL
jgi:hypothetical protein